VSQLPRWGVTVFGLALLCAALVGLVRTLVGSEASGAPHRTAGPHEHGVQEASDQVAAMPVPALVPPVRRVCAHPYLPIGEGASWTFRVSGGDGRGAVLSTLRVRVIRTIGQEISAEIEARRGDQSDVSTIRCSDDRADEPWQLALVPFGAGVRPFSLLRDLTAGETSTATFERPSFVRHGETAAIEVTRHTVVHGEETVSVPAGTFRAIHLSHEEHVPMPEMLGQPLGGESISRVDDWLAEGVGLVRRAIFDEHGAVTAEQVLVDFVPP